MFRISRWAMFSDRLRAASNFFKLFTLTWISVIKFDVQNVMLPQDRSATMMH